MSLDTFDHYCLSKNLTWIYPSCNFPSFLNNGFNTWRITDENIYNSLAHDYNSDDSDTSMIGESSFKPDSNATSTTKLTIKISNLFLKTSKLCALIVIA